MREFNKVEVEIQNTLNRIYELSLPETPNPLHSYIKHGSVDKTYLQYVISSLSEEKPFSPSKKHKNELTLLQAQNLKRRKNILPIVKRSYELLTSIFCQKKSPYVIPKFCESYKCSIPLSLQPNFTIDNFYLNR
jgi:hypothetical protein